MDPVSFFLLNIGTNVEDRSYFWDGIKEFRSFFL